MTGIMYLDHKAQSCTLQVHWGLDPHSLCNSEAAEENGSQGVPIKILSAVDFNNGILKKLSDLPRKFSLGHVKRVVELFCSL